LNRETPTPTFAALQAFRAKAIEMGLPLLAAAALIGWEWWQREIDIFATFEVNARGSSQRCSCHPSSRSSGCALLG
jgi:hypothetical protein